MVDEDLIRGNAMAKEGLKMLLHSGVLAEQMQRITERFTHGPADEPEEVLIQRVRDYRRERTFIESLQLLGESILSEGEE